MIVIGEGAEERISTLEHASYLPPYKRVRVTVSSNKKKLLKQDFKELLSVLTRNRKEGGLILQWKELC